MNNFADRLIAAIKAKGNPCVVGLDPRIDRMPSFVQGPGTTSVSQVGESIAAFNRGLGQQLEILRRQGLRQVGTAQLLERLAPRVTLERLAASGKLVFPAVSRRLFSDDSGGCVTLERRLDRTIVRRAVAAVERAPTQIPG